MPCKPMSAKTNTDIALSEDSRRESREKGQLYTHDSVYLTMVANPGDTSQRIRHYEARAAQAVEDFGHKFNGQGGKR